MTRGTKDLKEVVVTARRDREFGGYELGGTTSNTDDDMDFSSRPSSSGENAPPPQRGGDSVKLDKLRALSGADKDLISSLQAKLHERETELENRNITIAAIQRNFESLSAMCSSDRAELARLKGERNDKAQAALRLADSLKAATDRVAQLEVSMGNANKTADEYRRMQADYEVLKNKNVQNEESIITQLNSRSELSEKIKALQMSHNEVRSELEIEKRSMSALEAALEASKREREQETALAAKDQAHWRNKAKEAEDRAQQQEKIAARLKQRETALQARIDEQCDLIRDIQSNRSANESELQQKLQGLNDHLRTVANDKLQLEADLKRQLSRGEELQSQLEATMNSSKMNDQQLSAIEEEKRRIARNLNDTLRAKEEAETELRQRQAAHDEAAEALKREIEKARQERNSLNKNLTDARQTLDSQHERAQGTVGSLEDMIKELNRERDEYAARVEELVRRCDESDERMAVNYGAHDILKDEYTSLKEILASVARERDDLQAALRTVESDLVAVKAAHLEELKRATTQAKDREDALAAEVAAVKEKLDRLQSDNNHLSANLEMSDRADEVNHKLRQDLERMKGAEAEAAKLRKLVPEITSLRDKLKYASEQCEAMEDRLRELEKEKNLLNNQLDMADQDLKDANATLEASKFDREGAKKELGVTINKLVNAMEAEEGILTCMDCMKLFTDPIVYNPCGHAVCNTCAVDLMSGCQECGSLVSHKINATQLDQIGGKFEYKKQAMQALRSMIPS